MSPLYRPTPAELDALCDRLRAERLLGPGPGDALRLRTAIARLPPQPRDRLGHIIVAVLRTDPARAPLDEAIRPWLRRLAPVHRPDPADGITLPSPDAIPPTPAAPTDAPPPRRWDQLITVAACLALLALAPILGAPPDVPVEPATVDTADPPRPRPERRPPPPTTGEPAPITPAERAPLPRDPDVLIAWAATAAAAFALALFAATRREETPADPEPPPPIAYAPPPPPPVALDSTPRLVPREAPHRLAAGSGRAVADPQHRAFDAAATVRATAARLGKIPALRFRPRRRPEAIELWVDARARNDATLARALAELTVALDRSGVTWTRRHLLASHHLVDDRGARRTLDDLPADPDGTRVALLTDGGLLLKARGPARAALIRRLRRWPHLAIVRFGDDPEALAAHLDRVAPVLDPDALVPWLCAVERSRPAPVELTALRTWAALLALAPRPPSELDAFDLRADRVPALPPSAIDALRAGLTDADPSDLRGPPARRGALIGWLRARDPAGFDAALAWWRERLADDPTAGALLDLWHHPDHAARRLAATDRPLFDPLAHMVPADHPRADAITLPWRWSDLDADPRATLRALGFGAAVGFTPTPPRRRWPRAARVAFAGAVGLLAAAAAGWATAPGGFVRLPATVARPAMVPIRAGTFIMGSPESEVGRDGDETQHEVTLTQDYWIAETEVTQAQYAAVMGTNPSKFRGELGDENRPVEQVSWLDSLRYCNALSRREGLQPAYTVIGKVPEVRQDANGYRLPSEAEWEYAARAGTSSATFVGDYHGVGWDIFPALDEVAWYAYNSNSGHSQCEGLARLSLFAAEADCIATQPVAQKTPNPFGLYDMLGNVEEYTSEQRRDPYLYPNQGVGYSVRGGGFSSRAVGLRASDISVWFRAGPFLGFRPVRFAPE